MPYSYLSSAPAFGFETCNNHHGSYDGNNYITRNKIKIASYVPVAGTIIGLMRFYHLFHRPQESYMYFNKYSWALRSAMETIGVSLVLLVIDLIVTTGKEWVLKKTHSGKAV